MSTNAIFVLLCGLSLGVCAQTAPPLRPDAGSLFKQAEQEFALPLLTTPELLAEQPAPSAPIESSESVVWVKGFRFKGNTSLSDPQLQEVLHNFTNRPLNFAQLQQAANALILAYRRAGWVANCWLPQQLISEGVVELVIEESQLGHVQLVPQGVQRMDMHRLEAIARDALDTHPDWPSLDRVDEAVTRLQDLPGTAVTANLHEGAALGTTDLILLVNTDTPIQLLATLDNQGNAATGTQRKIIQTQLNNPLHLGDSAMMQLSQSQGSAYVRAGYSLPLGTQGLRLSTALSHFSYQLIGAFSALNAQGQVQAQSLELSAPFKLTPKLQTRWAWSFDHRNYANQEQLLGASNTLSQYGLDVHKLSLNAAWPSQLWGTAYNALQASLSHGKVDLSNSPNRDADAASANTQGQFSKLNVLWSRHQPWGSGWGLRTQAEIQKANKNLDSSEKIILGGYAGVRAYPTGEGAGSQGWTAKIELQKKWPERWMTALFYDHGQLLNTQDNLALSGYGLSLLHQLTDHIDLSATLSRRIGQNPTANPVTGNDTDGNRVRDRLWVALNFKN